MNDCFVNGIIAGIGAGIIQNLLNFISYGLHFTKLRYLDYASIFLYGNYPTIWIETIFAQLAQLIFNGFLGIIFAMLVPLIKKDYLLLKGWYYGTSVWFIINSIGALYKVPSLLHNTWQTVFSNFLTSSVYGLLLAYLIWRLENSKAKVLK